MGILLELWRILLRLGRILRAVFFVLPGFLVTASIGFILLFIQQWISDPFWQKFIHDTAVALIAVGVTGPLSAYYLHSQIGQYLSIIRNTTEAGIINIFSKRGGNLSAATAIQTILEEEQEKILLAGIGLADFFVDDPGKITFCDLIRKKIPQLKDGLFVLLLNPASDVCEDRSQLEEGHQTKHEIIESKDAIQALIKQYPGKIKLKLYDHYPIAFVLITSKCIFVEQYHLGRPERQGGGCIGRRVPLLQARNDSLLYAYMKAHFNNIWDTKSKPPA